MEKYEVIDKFLKNHENICDLYYSKEDIRNMILDFLENKIENFNYGLNYDNSYVLKIFDYFPYFFQNNLENKKEYYIKIKTIREKIKVLLIQKPGNISKCSDDYKFLKELIDKLETFSLSLLYDYIDKYDGSKYEFINFLIFEVKQVNILEDAIKRFPYIVNFETKEGDTFIDNVIKNYINEVTNYTFGKELNLIDNIIYYDEILKLLLNCPKLNFSIINKNKWIKQIDHLINDIDSKDFNSLTKQKYVFFLNDLINTLNNKFEVELDYLKYKYDIKSNFNQSINFECKRAINKNIPDNQRTIINDIIITVDGKNAKEIDDALSIKKLENGNYLLGIHIADPLYYVNPNSIIYDEAKRRTTAIYLPNMIVPMLPTKLSSDLASLIEHELRPALSYYYEISNNMEVVDYKFVKSFIKVYKNMTYNQFNKFYKKGSGDKNINETIENLINIYPLLSNKYKIDPYYKKINRSINNITDTNIIGGTISEKLVESSMVFNNYMVAKYFDERKLPFIYRIHSMDEKTISKINDFSNTINIDNSSAEYLEYLEMIRNIYPQSIYSTENKGHFGLGLKFYSHITSPLRRFADIVAIECLDKMYFNEYKDTDIYNFENYLKETIDRINQKRLSIEVFSNKYRQKNL